MKEFRVVNCIEKGTIREYAIFTDGSRKKVIEEDRQYGKFFSVDNEFNPGGGLLKYSFTGRIQDAVETIRNGDGDCLKTFNLFGTHESVAFFLNRNIGEELRQKSIDGWKNTKFGWQIKAGNKNSFFGYSPLNLKGEKIGMFDEDRKPMIFETEKEAKEYAEHLVLKAWEYANLMVKELQAASNDEERNMSFDRIYTKVVDETSKFSIIIDFLSDMMIGDNKLKFDECKLDEMGYRISQCVA
ncbi:hypothetical protein FYJ38_00195 [Clostridium sp. WB02_MRS01]|uniref:hypothetical protein n=1 Tax=Clostridium sp. WB02_MRS01 TaxID=2605777 RepID=UPI0012B3DE08|nr:hypothetical protein [Clostridium sp. WB02_MRS01]MSS07058.1 hypothetical protein [Clostridium sp. WB02_MRS01]